MPRERADRIQLLGLESSTRSLAVAARLVERSSKVRILGAMALSMAHTAAGALDAFCAPVPMRVFDMTAGLPFIGETRGVGPHVRGGSAQSVRCHPPTRTDPPCPPGPPSPDPHP